MQRPKIKSRYFVWFYDQQIWKFGQVAIAGALKITITTMAGRTYHVDPDKVVPYWVQLDDIFIKKETKRRYSVADIEKGLHNTLQVFLVDELMANDTHRVMMCDLKAENKFTLITDNQNETE